MAVRAICVAVLLSVLPAAGCGTVANLARSRPGEGGVSPFGGVRQDVWCIRKAASGEFGARTQPGSESEQYPQLVLLLASAADLPLSLIGDIATWPYTVAYSFINQPIPTPAVTLVPAEGWPQTSPPALVTIPRTLPLQHSATAPGGTVAAGGGPGGGTSPGENAASGAPPGG